MFQRVHTLWRLLSQLPHCSDGSVSVIFAVQFASLVLRDDILCHHVQNLLKKFLCLHVDKCVTFPCGCFFKAVSQVG